MARSSGLLLVWVCLLGSVASSDDDSNEGIEGDVSEAIDTMDHFQANKDGRCAFPFTYNNGTFYACIKSLTKHKWCSLNSTYSGYWKYCGKEDIADCVFPFWYKRLIYWDCTSNGDLFGKKWCSLTQNYNQDRIWRYCD